MKIKFFFSKKMTDDENECLPASFNRSPMVLALLTRSLPAKSTK